MNELALFAGSGGGILGGKLLGWNTVCAVEREAFPAQVLAQRQNDGILPIFPIWSDITSFDGKPWRGFVNVVSGGFPCQDLSSAKAGIGEGLNGRKSGLWYEMLRIIGEVAPKWVFIENSPNLRKRGLDKIIKELTNIGYGVAWGVYSAKQIGANHERKRIWIVAHSNSTQCERGSLPIRRKKEHTNIGIPTWWKDQPRIHGVDDGVAHRVDRLKSIGNGQVPIVAARAFFELSERLSK